MSRVDVVVFGATGFTGRHAVERLAQLGERRRLRWAVAARNPGKLHQLMEKVVHDTGEDLSAVKIIIADVQNEESLRSMCEQTKVLVSCCGPYTLYGEAVVRAAIQCKTHYVDCSGEPYFNQVIKLKYDKQAREAGVYVVNACGVESIPVDLGTLYLQQNFDGILNSVESYMNAGINDANINSGTWVSFIYSLPHFFQLPALRKKNYPPNPALRPKLKQRFLHRRFNAWCIPFPINDSLAVYHTQSLLYQQQRQRPVQIKTYYKLPSLLDALTMVFCAVLYYIMSHFKVTRELLLKHSSYFSNGIIARNEPPEEVIRKKSYEFFLCGVGWERSEREIIDALPPRKSMIVKISGKNPGYGMTVMGLLFSVVAILDERDKMPAGGGVLSPGAAFGNTKLVQHLQENGVKFEIIDKY